MTIRSLLRGELEEAWQLHKKGFPCLDEITREDYLQPRFNLEFDLDQIVVAYVDGKLAGKIEVYIWLSLDEGKTSFMDGFVVDPAYRRQGIGTQLLLEAEKRAKKQGATQVELGAKTFCKAAIALYEKLGYKQLHKVFFMKARLKDFQSTKLPANIRARFAGCPRDPRDFMKMDQAVWWGKTTQKELKNDIERNPKSFLVLECNGKSQAFIKYGLREDVDIYHFGISKNLTMPISTLLRLLISEVMAKATDQRNLYLEVDENKTNLINALLQLGFKTYEIEFHMKKQLI